MSAALPFGPDYGFGLYVHWPYCTRICPYCDFNVYAAKDRDTSGLVEALLRDIAWHRRRLPGHGALDTIFFGGGTPSLMDAGDIARLIETAALEFGLAPDAEITLEANPNDVTPARVDAWAQAGVNRLSIGVQSLDDGALGFLGREHNAATARAALAMAERRFENRSIDLIYALPGQTPEGWARELEAALDLGAPHLSLYELTIAERTVFAKRAERGEIKPLDADAQADLYELTGEVTQSAGLAAYEVSNHAADTAFQSRHNLIYWRGGDWIGIGPGAHGRLTLDVVRQASLAARRPGEYAAAAGPELTPLTHIEAARELIALGLRPAEGIALWRIEALAGGPLDAARLEDFRSAGLLTLDAGQLALTPQGALLADRIAAELAP